MTLSFKLTQPPTVLVEVRQWQHASLWGLAEPCAHAWLRHSASRPAAGFEALRQWAWCDLIFSQMRNMHAPPHAPRNLLQLAGYTTIRAS
jgi:hypothetical protein